MIDAPATSPAVRLRCELSVARREGLAFDAAWAPSVLLATADLPDAGQEGRQTWRMVLSAQRAIWRAAYDRQAVPEVGILAASAD